MSYERRQSGRRFKPDGYKASALSRHEWLEGQGPCCTLIVFIDDATSRLTALRFSPAETTAAYLAALKSHVLAHGSPLAFYSDKHSIFRVNAKDAVSGDGKTEFGHATERLKIELINASTPQAKGRVERANPDFALANIHTSGPADQGHAAGRHLHP